MNSLQSQIEAILAVPTGGAVVALALAFFGLMAGTLQHVIEKRAKRRVYMRGLAARMQGRGDA